MKRIERNLHAVIAGLVVVMTSLPGRVEARDRPNIVFMLSDDQGWNGLSVAMHPHVPGSRGEIYHTPNLEKLASQGMRFSAAYAPAPVCSPTRACLQTGKTPAFLHWTKAAPPETGHKLLEPQLVKRLSEGEVTIAELLKHAGYATAHYGKWHISGGGPGNHGYDEHDGDTGNEQAFKFHDPNPVDIFGMAERAERFMEKSSKQGQPFFIQLSWNALHAPENALKATMAKYEKLIPGDNTKKVATAAMTEDLDTGVGRVMASLERLGLSENTYVVYMADNGAGGGKKSLRGGKGGLWEGGIRVPLIIRGPGVESNSWCHTPVVGYDFLPTFCEWGQVPPEKLPENLPGGSFSELLTDGGEGEVRRSRPGIVFHFPHYQGQETPQSAIIEGSLKLLKFYEDDHVELYDLSKDIGERTNLASKLIAEADRLKLDLEKSLTEDKAQFSTRNPNYEPGKEPVKKSEGGARGGGGNKNGGERGSRGGKGGRGPNKPSKEKPN